MSREEEVSSQVPCPPSGLNIFGQGAKQPSFCYHFYSSSAMIEGSFVFFNVILVLNFAMLSDAFGVVSEPAVFLCCIPWSHCPTCGVWVRSTN